MGVFTSSQFFSDNKSVGKVAGNKPVMSHVPKPDDINKFMFRFASKGKSTAQFEHINMDNKIDKFKIELNDGIFDMPKDWSKKKKEFYRDMLLDQGFEDVSVIVREKTKVKDDKKKYNYFAGHPDNKIDNLIGNEKPVEIVVKVKGKEIKLECDNGFVTTSNIEIFQALIEKGYNEYKEKEEIK